MRDLRHAVIQKCSFYSDNFRDAKEGRSLYLNVVDMRWSDITACRHPSDLKV